jgi:hypothetical protein
MMPSHHKPFFQVEDIHEEVATFLSTDVSGSSDEESKEGVARAPVDDFGSSDEELWGANTAPMCEAANPLEEAHQQSLGNSLWSLLHSDGDDPGNSSKSDIRSDVLMTSEDMDTELVDLDPEEGALRGQILLSMLSDFEASGTSSQDNKVVVNNAVCGAVTASNDSAWTQRAVNAPLFTPSFGMTSNFGKGDLKIDNFKASLTAMVESAFGDWCCGVYQSVDGLRIELQKSDPLKSWSGTKAEAYERHALYQALDVVEQSIWDHFEEMVVDVKRIQGSTQLVVHVMSGSEKAGLCWEFTHKGYCPRFNRCRWIHAVPTCCVVDVVYS